MCNSSPPTPPARTSRGSLLWRGVGLSLGLVLLLELGLRLTGRPSGRYVADLLEGGASAGGPWQPGYRGTLRSGPVPYRVSVNAHGFRGPELRLGKRAAELRLVALGDSFTEGFYVDDAQTYPAQLQLALEEAGRDVEVINAARGGGSIDRFVQIWERCVKPLEPDVVLVTFVSNDLSDLGWFPLEQAAPAGLSRLGSYFVGHSALGEWFFDLSFGTPLQTPREPTAGEPDARYRIAGGTDYRSNAAIFMQRYGPSDGLVLGQELDATGQRAFAIYDERFRFLADQCRAARARLFLIYVPAYPEVYIERPPSAGRKHMQALAQELGLGYLDLTQALRRASVEEGLGALHLAPLDFHLNPSGQRVVARELAQALASQGFLEAGRK